MNKNFMIATALSVMAVVSPVAMASPESEAAMASISAEAVSLLALAWPVAVTIVVGAIGIKLFKKFASKAT